MNARKLGGTWIGIAQQFPDEKLRIKSNLVFRNEEGESTRAQSASGSRHVVCKQCQVQTFNILLYIILV